MSKLEELIEQYCPDGVEWKHLEEFCEIKTGKGITKKDSNENGTYPIISGGVTPMGYYHIFNREGRTVTISRVGANAGLVSFIDKRFYLNDKCFSIIPSNGTNTKFLYYILSAREADIKGMQSEGGVPTINTQKVGSIKIPVPPLPVQEEIVRMLDAFTELQAERQAELQAELQKRLQQYNYYRDFLLSFEGRTDVQWKKLEDLGVNLDRKRKPIASGKRVKGDIPYYGASGIVDYVEGYIFEGDYLLVSEDGANLLTRTYPIAFSIHGKTWVNNHAHVIEFKERATRKYVEYYLNSIDLSPWISAGAQPKLTQDSLNKLTIPIPPLEEQNRIVSILDRFDTLTNDLTSGLPAEMEKRRQQYEYYRDRLLTFKRKEA